jgi:hypothetical protein
MLDQNTEAIHERIKAVFDLVDESFAVTPVVTVRGGSGVNINQFRIWAPPTSLQTNELSDQSLSGKVKIDRIYDTQLLGSLTNEGAASTVVRIYLNNDDATDIQAGLVAEGVIDPGQTIQGADLEVDGAQDRAASELENYLGGDHVHYDIVMVSLMPIKVQADNLQLHAKVDVHAQIF